MTRKDKQLLFKDLSARLPYHVRCKIWLKEGSTEEGFLDLEHNYGDVLLNAFYYNEIKDIKPYLFPLSSMTTEQKKEFDQLLELELKAINDEIDPVQTTIFEVDFYNKHHLDWRGLIPKGLAIDATGLNIY